MPDCFEKRGLIIDDIRHLSPKESYDLCLKGAVIVDVREEYMNNFKMFGVENVIFCPYSILADNYSQFPAGKILIFADATGLKSKESLLLLKEKGIENIANMAGGLVEWERDGLPLNIDKTNRLRGSCMCQLKFRDKNKTNG
jgi:rhodanese-related sulfurtransferase